MRKHRPMGGARYRYRRFASRHSGHRHRYFWYDHSDPCEIPGSLRSISARSSSAPHCGNIRARSHTANTGTPNCSATALMW